MLTVMCPNCRHRFPAPGCCNPPGVQGTFVATNDRRAAYDDGVGIRARAPTTMNNDAAFYGGGYLLVPRDYNAGGGGGGGCFINAPTIINGPTIIQQSSIIDKIEQIPVTAAPSWLKTIAGGRPERDDETMMPGDRRIDGSCALTGATVTIATPGIQSGGCLIRAKDTDVLVRSPVIEIRPRVSLIGGGGCFVKKHHHDPRSEEASSDSSDENEKFYDDDYDDDDDLLPPSGCQELPGSRFSSGHRDSASWSRNVDARDGSGRPSQTKKRHSTCCCSRPHHHHHRHPPSRPANDSAYSNNERPTNEATKNATNETSRPMEIRVNATVQLPPTVAHCTLNITATTGNSNATNDGPRIATGRRDNFNGGGLVRLENEARDDETTTDDNNATSINERRDEAPPTTPLSWLMPCPWGFDNYAMDKDGTRLAEIKRLLRTSGWYHEGLSWQQSETLLENASLGRWLVRDSSDSRFVFAVSVQTARGPTSVRVHYFLGRFRLDAEPRMSLAMPMFECPIKMLQHYVDYSKRIDEHRKEVWVDYSGQLYSQIYLTKPLAKDVQTLSHLARIAVNRYKFNVDYLPPLIKNYLAEYPYCL